MGRSRNEGQCSSEALSPARQGQDWAGDEVLGRRGLCLLDPRGVAWALGTTRKVLHSGEQLLRALQREELGPFCEQVLINPHSTPAAFVVTRSSQPEEAALPWLPHTGEVLLPTPAV